MGGGRISFEFSEKHSRELIGVWSTQGELIQGQWGPSMRQEQSWRHSGSGVERDKEAEIFAMQPLKAELIETQVVANILGEN